MSLSARTVAPDFTLSDQNGENVSLNDLSGSRALIVFIPFPFTGHCDNEACQLRDGLSELGELDAKVVVVTTHAAPTNAEWASKNNFEFPVLSDYWPHGEVSKAYGTFNDDMGCANRVTYVLDKEGVIRDVIDSDSLGTPREYELYGQALAQI